ncbi:hypothetical protein KAFR_0D04830 [Kazachstania africana CBS 2517]|uniref:RRM domain-containing protein n=1 Tax=Kazachstania africana (strain ATCC 22294 / BCRC 22015 / CBS 2517 / CECT 1963 / NBRC 1671 / NRRL Y-8276) TaxID=1071382 RepID=H2AUT0_KAZAF|nr:hypothetical protein KAFR_0D04830 [Kazachstania africana CBS 2517]CCF58130.1 hypothetical protein KAFR_0D04830 [Kazachstania africana CBS 2517]
MSFNQTQHYNVRQNSNTVANTNSNNNPVPKGNVLYMGDLDLSWDERVVSQIWASLGEPNVSVKMMNRYCFITFLDSLTASNALLKNGMLIPGYGGKRLKLNWAQASSNASNGYSIFVGDLSPNVTEAQLFDLFINKYASTDHAKIVYDQATGVSRGYGFVRFNSLMDQQHALLEMQGIFLNGRAIKIGMTGNKQGQLQGQQHQGQQQQDFKVPIQSNTPMNQSQFMYPVQQQPTLNHFTDPNNTTVFVGGLSSLVTEDELREYFKPFGTIVYVKIPVGKGCGFVQYIDRVSAENAISKMQGFPIANSRIRLSWGRSAKQTALLQQQLYQQQRQPQLVQQNYSYVPPPMNAKPSNNHNNYYLPGFQTADASSYSNDGDNNDQENINVNATTNAFQRLERGSNASMFT